MGSCYEKGIGVSSDPERAVEYYRLAIQRGYGMGILHLASCYRRGFGVTQNLSTAIDLLQDLAEQGHQPSQVCGNRVFSPIRWSLCIAIPVAIQS